MLSIAASAVAQTYADDFFGHSYVRPSYMRFSVDGDLIGTHLSWHSWGGTSATATGVFLFRTTPSTQVARRGTVTFTGRNIVCGNPVTYVYSITRFNVAHNPWGRRSWSGNLGNLDKLPCHEQSAE
jgi:hypothetical protein